ncbi:cyclase family protein [Anaerospora sp.]|jgi:kynurenine formamidase|uniref:cyclase family protein n=1 Tax=Anaerospora sp. TaxID=1960278 RepID=UPI0028A2BAB2|nr:cyclase family protein [Anaerospora sp.]MDF2949035.1 cyclase family protein [Sedimentibacter sp.]
MKIDLSFKVDKEVLEELAGSVSQAYMNLEKQGHVGTHFDVRDKEFSIDKIITKGRVFNISHIKTGEVKVNDLDLSNVEKGDFVMFYSGILKQLRYGSKEYLSTYIELSNELIDYLIDKEVNFIGVDMAGAQKPATHLYIDQYCADRGIFIIENLDNLDLLLEKAFNKPFTVYTFPVNMSGFSGLPCRVIAEI